MSCFWTGDTATETARGAAACAFCCFDSPPLHAERNRKRADKMKASERCGMRTPETTFCGEKTDRLFFKELVRYACFALLRPLETLLLDVYILNSVAVTLVRECGIVSRGDLPPATVPVGSGKQLHQ